MLEPVTPGSQLVLLARLEMRGIDVGYLILQHLPRPQALSLVLPQIRQLSGDLPPRGIHRPVLRQRGAVPGVGIQQRQVRRLLHQLLIVALPVDIDQQGADLAEQALRHGTPADPRNRLAVAAERALEQDPVLVLRQLHAKLRKRRPRRLIQPVEQGRDHGILLARADQVAADPPACQGVEAVNQQGFSGARLTRQDAQTLGKVDIRLPDDCHIPDVERAEHIIFPLPAGSWCGGGSCP